MNLLAVSFACLFSTGLLAGSADTQGLEIRYSSLKRTQLAGEPTDLRLFLVNGGAAPAHVARCFLTNDIRMEIEGEWVECVRWQGTPGVPDVEWQQVDPGAQVLIGGRELFWCPKDAGPASNRRDWREVAGNYKLQVEVSHRIPSDEVARTGPPPDGAREWTLRSNIIDIAVKEPYGIDAEALQWARQHGHAPISVQVANQFPSSRYAALTVWWSLTTVNTDPEHTRSLIAKGLYPGSNSVPDPGSPNGWRSVNKGEDMARWRIEQGERLLREQQDFPYERDVRLSIAVSYAVLGNKEKATQLLRALAKEARVPESPWAERFLALQGW